MIETCWSDFKCFNVKKNYVCALVGVLIKYLGLLRVTTHPVRTDLILTLVSLTTLREAPAPSEIPGYMPSHFMLVIARPLQ
jgi:hypothetical protein